MNVYEKLLIDCVKKKVSKFLFWLLFNFCVAPILYALSMLVILCVALKWPQRFFFASVAPRLCGVEPCSYKMSVIIVYCDTA